MALSDYWNKFTSGLTDFFTDEDGLDWSNIGLTGVGAAGLGALYNSGALDGMFNSQSQQVGYQGKIPRYEMIRDRVERPNQERRAGGQGQRYFSRPRFATAENAPAARAESQAEAQQLGMARGGLASIQRFANGGMPMGAPQPSMGMPKPPMQANNLMGMKPPMPAQRPPQGIMGALKPQGAGMPPPQGAGMPKPPQMPQMPAGGMPPMPPQAAPQAPAGPMEPMDVLNSLASTGKVQPMPKPMPPQMPKPMGFANGGIADINRPQSMALSQMNSPVVGQPNPFAARSAQVDNPRYLGGNTDGMADRIPANIDGSQPAALSDGEFVIPADVVSHLGNGNSNAGAQQLYGMMDKIRQARTGNTQQGRQINPNQFMPRV